ncbi:5-carboxymethyl-2-hydroxymuconate Delta-isomerase [Shewanella sp. AS16]|uniref:5-carboxymethyl-2-hydroxymuconate Delta-isomerase n=1 Tax=Shewanella sp. AS16 TaxID=2907625 RepID=UPI001F3A3BAB|nr:5-carboxymethyl-2-hydroxymuconate Delta-isomerase [Shewanella sp. AS16]MCE9684862.1 5-carboxymethyl-2-hydroxymuconate Delta-isomerase [Shewanella sp. AS16]
MPHCVIEYSAPLAEVLAIDELVRCVHQGAIASALFEPASIKTRALRCEHFAVGEAAGSFIHIGFAIMPGRSQAQKQQLTRAVYDLIAHLVAEVDSLTMNITELDDATYFKQVS